MNGLELTLCRANTDCVIGHANGLAVAVWRYHTSAEDVPELTHAARRAHAASGRPIGLLQVVLGTAITPDGPARAALARMLRELNGSVSSSAIVHDADGFRAAMIRSIVTGVTRLSNPGYPHRVFAKVADAAAWMSQNDARFQAERVELAVCQMRAGTGPREGARSPRAAAPLLAPHGR
jgi:hypothetical protein